MKADDAFLRDRSVLVYGPEMPWSADLAARLKAADATILFMPADFDAGSWDAWAAFAAVTVDAEKPLAAVIAWPERLPASSVCDTDGAALSQGLDTALDPLVLLVRHFVPLLASGSAVTLVTSVLSGAGLPGNGVAAIVAGGARLIAKSIAVELGPRGIRANSVHLPVDGHGAPIAGELPVSAATVADTIMFTLSPEARFMSGADIQAGATILGVQS